MNTYKCTRCGKTLKSPGRGGYGPTCAVYVLGPLQNDGEKKAARKKLGRKVKRKNRRGADNRQLPLELEVACDS